VKVVAHRYDFEAYERGDVDIDADPIALEVEAHLIEVKATRTSEAKMTSTQAGYATQNPDRYILCVVNLGEVDPSLSLDTLTDSEVEVLIRLIPTIGRLIALVYQSVTAAPTPDIHVEHTDQVRYCMGKRVWSNGLTLVEWTSSVAQSAQDRDTSSLGAP
jgi:hypothetical protein